MGKLYDLIIIGSGSAGMTAGIYAGRSKLKTLILEKDAPGGQIKITSEVVNYPGIMLTSGEELSATMRRQAENFGVEFTKATVLSADFSGDIKKIHTTVGDYEALSVIIATGAKPRTLGFKGEAEYRGRGIGYCATCDGGFFAGKDVFVIGAGFAAAEEAIYLTRYARKVTVIAREPEFTCSKSIAEKVLAHPKIEVKFNTEIIEAGGDSVLKYARFINNKTNEEWQYDVDDKDSTFGIFIFVGYIPESAEFKDSVKTDEYGYIITDDEMRTNIDGVYAAGDVRPKILRQLVTATADGAIAATSAERYITAIKERLGIRTEDENVDVDGKGNAVASASKAEMKATQGAEQKKPQEKKAEGQHYFDDSLREQIASVLERFENTVTLAAVLDPTHETYGELVSFLTDFSSLSDKIKLKMLTKGEDEEF
ncbi:MAG TPA: FAD-dependent oxidoreductase, partial [Bacillota bacterium]|nr:FAD-dependent oxidoreductase [Bacillota bacterium]